MKTQSSSVHVNNHSIGFLGLLAIVFITLKLTSVISWSWWWVLLPLYGIPALLLGLAALAFMVAGLAWVWGKVFG